MDFNAIAKRFLETIKESKYILIYIKGSPDPDVIASSFAIKIICDKVDVKAKIVSVKKPSLPQNKAIIDDLRIPIHFEELSSISNFDSYIVPDHQSALVQGVSYKIPCAVHMDHHEPVDEDIPIKLKITLDEAGSVSTIMALILNELSLDLGDSLLTRVSTALLYGIKTDTDNYKHATHLDYQALSYLSKYFDRDEIQNIADIPITDEMGKLIAVAVKNKIIYKDWLLSGIGFINESNRDSIAIIADLLLQNENVSTTIVFAAVQKNNDSGLTLDASIRTENENLDLNELIKSINSEGGGRRFKGAYQVNLDYFTNCPDREMLWETIKTTTIEVLKKHRDAIHIIELRGSYKKIKRRIKDIFRTAR